METLFSDILLGLCIGCSAWWWALGAMIWGWSHGQIKRPAYSDAPHSFLMKAAQWRMKQKNLRCKNTWMLHVVRLIECAHHRHPRTEPANFQFYNLKGNEIKICKGCDTELKLCIDLQPLLSQCKLIASYYKFGHYENCFWCLADPCIDD